MNMCLVKYGCHARSFVVVKFSNTASCPRILWLLCKLVIKFSSTASCVHKLMGSLLQNKLASQLPEILLCLLACVSLTIHPGRYVVQGFIFLF